MKPALGYRWIKPLQTWHQIPIGQLLHEKESEVINDRLQYCFGQHLIKLGSLSSDINTSCSFIDHQINVGSELNSSSAVGVISEFDELPFQSNSVGAVVANHVIEYCADPHQVLRELHRVLIANGNLVISIFNPFSLIALQRFVPSSFYHDFKKGRFFTVGRVKDWLNLLGFEIVDEQQMFYTRLGQQHEHLDEGTWPKFIKTLMPWSAGVTVITAKKREWPLTPVRPRLRYKTIFRPTITGTTASTSRQHNKVTQK